MNKKGIDYALLLWVVVAIGVILLYVTLSNRILRTGTVGEVEIPIMKIKAERAFLDNYVENAAKLSAKEIKPEACAYANTQSRPLQLTMEINIGNTATTQFNTKMNEYLKAYASKTKIDIPLDNYELYFTKGEMAGIAVQPMLVPLKDFTGRTIGTFSYRPNFKIKYDHKLEEYPQIKATLLIMANECSHKEKPADCATQRLPQGWTVTNTGEEYTFIDGKTKACYILYLPEKTTTPTI